MTAEPSTQRDTPPAAPHGPAAAGPTHVSPHASLLKCLALVCRIGQSSRREAATYGN